MLMATFHHPNGDVASYLKGAPGRVIERCDRMQSPNGETPLDEAGLARNLEASLRRSGLPHPRVTIRIVSVIGRHPDSGKARRFIPLS